MIMEDLRLVAQTLSVTCWLSVRALVGFDFEPSCNVSTIAPSIAQLPPRTRSLMNAGMSDSIFREAKRCLDARSSLDNPSVDFSLADVKEACVRIPPPPPDDSVRTDLSALFSTCGKPD